MIPTEPSPQLKDRRRGYRKRVDCSAIVRPTVHLSTNEKSQVVHVFDLSTIGVGFSASQAFRIGEVFRFALCDRKQAGSRIEIRSCRQRPDGMFDVGGQFC